MTQNDFYEAILLKSQIRRQKGLVEFNFQIVYELVCHGQVNTFLAKRRSFLEFPCFEINLINIEHTANKAELPALPRSTFFAHHEEEFNLHIGYELVRDRQDDAFLA